MNNQLEQYKIEIPNIDLPDFYIPKIEIPNFSTDNKTILEINNTVFFSGSTSRENSLLSSSNHETSTLANPSDPLFSLQWHLLNPNTTGIWGINALDVWQDYTGKGVSVSVIDSGVDPNHPDLRNNFDYINQFDAETGQQGLITLESGATINFGAPKIGDAHGTSVAGLIAAERNDVGVVGVAYESRIIPIYSNFNSPINVVTQITNSFAHAAKFDVSNNSWGSGSSFLSNPNGAFNVNFQNPELAAAAKELEKAVENGRDELGTIFVQSADNYRQYGDDVNLHNFQNSRYNITVAATLTTGKIAEYSTPGAALTVSAPSSNAPSPNLITTDIVGTDGYSPLGDYALFSGTSGSAPIVSGVVALMLEANPNLGWRDVQEILSYSAVISDGTSPSWQINGANNWNGGGLTVSHDFGAGLVNAHGALRLSETWQTQHTSDNEEVVSVSSTDSSPLVIPDNDSTGISSSVTVASGLDIDYVELELHIDHNFIGDLEVTLTSPNGTVSKLVNRPGMGILSDVGSNQDNINFVFGSTQHWGETGEGEWTVRVKDLKTGDFGRLNDYTLRLYGDEINGNDTYIYTDEFGVFGNIPTRQILNDQNGVDTINAAAVTSNSLIDLNPNSLSTIAGINTQIASDTKIENVFTGDGNDTLTGNDSRNILSGGRGEDMLTGGANNDVLSGNGGSDEFVFDTGSVFNISDLGVDRILDFVVGDDQIRLSKNTFTALDNTANGQLLNSDFEVVTNRAQAKGSSAEIVYNSNNGNLYYNENNTAAGFGNGGLFAKLVGSPSDLSGADFQVVDV